MTTQGQPADSCFVSISRDKLCGFGCRIVVFREEVLTDQAGKFRVEWSLQTDRQYVYYVKEFRVNKYEAVACDGDASPCSIKVGEKNQFELLVKEQ